MDSTLKNQNAPALPTTERSTAKRVPPAVWVCPEFKVSGVFSSHMVLQREKPIRIWGFSRLCGSRVTGSFMGETVTTAVGTDNRFMLTFSARPYCRDPQVMQIFDDAGHTVTFEDILIGDVWLIGGQSNAELTLRATMSVTPSITFDGNDNFRLFRQMQGYPFEHPELCAAPQPDVIHPQWCWKRPDKVASLTFSAMGWHFAREVTKHIDCPLGLIMMAAGGACIRELVPTELAHEMGYDYGANVIEGGFFNTLIHPFIGLSFKAMLFFQGESEGLYRDLSEKYGEELGRLVADERARFGIDFPFYNIQLSDYREEGEKFFPFLDMIRIHQFNALKEIPRSTLTVDMDLGSPDGYPDWAHSPFKMELGERLARLALAKEYGVGREEEASSPIPIAAMLSPDLQQITVTFTNVSAGLIVSGHAPVDSYGMDVQGFSVGDYAHKMPAHAIISARNAVTVDIPQQLQDAVRSDPDAAKQLIGQVNYAFSLRITPENADLRGGNNLPAPAFSLPVTATF